MATPTPDQRQRISPADLDDIVARARTEAWDRLALIGPGTIQDHLFARCLKAGWPARQVFRLDRSLGAKGVRALTALSNLTSLNLADNDIGEEGARALAALTNLSSLDLFGNRIGDEGARALTALTNLSSLDLYGNDIGAEGARALAALPKLLSLDLWDNDIGDDGALALTALTNLMSLDLQNNSIGDEGARALATLGNLTLLDLGGNSIGRKGAVALSAMTNLKSLGLLSNRVGDEGARALAALTNLTSLDLGGNQIGDEGARALAALTNLTSLNLRGNQVGDEGARALAVLKNLARLLLGDNAIGDEGVRALAALTNLTSLDFPGNRIGDDGARVLLDAWVDRPGADRLRYLDLRRNGDLSTVLPPEALDSTDAQAILAAHRRYRDAVQRETLRPLDEAKLLVVGNEAVGKTSLIRYLVHDLPRDKDEAKTPGAAIHERIETAAWSPAESRVTVNVWDFGGQEIMHGTHRFFLTERSLYLLVLENRREDDRSVYDWLKTIRNRGGDSPVIVVINKCDDDRHELRLDETGLARDHGIVGVVRTSCDPGERAATSIAGLRRLIAETLASDERLKHVRDPIPQAWLRVKDAVAALARAQRVLEVRAYERLCEQPPGGADDEAITDPDEQRALLRLLHDLGTVVAHGLRRDARAALREVTLLDPNWLTGAIYTLLNSRTVADQGGEFDRAQLPALLDPEAYPPRWHEFILDMMEAPDIGLAFELPGSRHERYLIPEALPATEPDYGNWPADSLRFRYAYELIPRSLIPRFIVQAHRNLTEKPTRWRTGVVLGAVDCRILVRGDRDRRRIDILVDGPVGRRRAALNVVLNDLDAVHALNPEIGAKALVPLADQPELDVSYDHLLKLEDRYGLDHAFDPEDAERAYTVRDLLEGVRRESTASRWEVPDAAFGVAHADDRMHHRARRAQLKSARGDAGDEGQLRAPPGDRSPAEGHESTAVPAESSWWSAFPSWRFFSIACGVGAVFVAIVLLQLPSYEWRMTVGGLLGLGLLVTAFMLSINPQRFYRRWLSYVIPAGLLLNAIGFSFEVFGLGRYDGTISWSFFLAWAAVVGFLVWGDSRRRS